MRPGRSALLAAFIGAAVLAGGCDGRQGMEIPRPEAAALGGERPRTLSELARLPEREIDIAHAAILIAQSEYPDLDVERYEREIEAMAAELRRALSGRAITGRSVARALSRVVYSKVKARPTPINEITDVTISEVLEKRTGTCLSLTTLTLAVGGKLSLPLKAVLVPRHVFVRYADGASKLNIETTRGGVPLPDEFYVRWKSISPGEIRRGVYLRELSHKEFIAQILVGQASATSRTDPARAERQFKLALEFHPSSPMVLYNLGVLAARAKDLKAAEEFYNAALIVNPDFAECYVNRGSARARMGRPKECVVDCTRALSLNPRLVQAHINRASAWGLLGDLARAEADYLRALKLDADNGVVHLMLARIAASTGRTSAASGHLRKAIAGGAITESEAAKAPEFRGMLR